ncbi:MAG: hypothetical protein COA69_07025 [Robiginitomaculum sp.]|nr:MAG: hypothetical protein COA69_07025 [Robiginitomaculum sp.]
MNLKRLLRQIHYWMSLAIFLPCGIIFMAGIFLMLKKEISWIQPPTVRGTIVQHMPDISYAQMLRVAQRHPEVGISNWSDIKKIDVRPDKGMAKLISKTGWELQIDTANAEVLSVAYRRSDMIESIHDGSFFTGWMKLYIFLPTGIVLIFMWGTGIYLFLLPQLAKRKKSKKKKAKQKL